MPATDDRFGGVGRVAMCFDADAAAGDVASRDVFDQMEAAETVFHRAGIAASRVPVSPDLGRLRKELHRFNPDVVLNLVESLDGYDRLQTVVPLVLESWGFPFTGCGSASMLLSNDKLATKRLLHRAGVAVPVCAAVDAEGNGAFFPDPAPTFPGVWILKPLDTHASMFMDDASVMAAASEASLLQEVALRTERHRVPFFAEQFVPGREFNLSILELDGRPTVLPAAEICFDLPPGRPQIVGYAAKWDEDSVEYQGTRRVFPDPAKEGKLLDTLGEAAMAVWRVLGLSGYARVDFRVDSEARPLVLEANANPCLSPDAGFAAAAEKAGMEYHAMLAAIIGSALHRSMLRKN